MELVFLESTSHLATNQRWLEPLPWPDRATIHRKDLDIEFMGNFLLQIYGQQAAAHFAGQAVPAETQQR